MWFATGGSFPDALAAGPAVAKDGGVLLLVPGSSTFLNEEATDWLDRFQQGIDRLRLIGGSAAIGNAIDDKARHQLLFRSPRLGSGDLTIATARAQGSPDRTSHRRRRSRTAGGHRR